MDRQLKCGICGDLVKQNKNPAYFANHLSSKHPQVCVTHFSSQDVTKNNSKKRCSFDVIDEEDNQGYDYNVPICTCSNDNINEDCLEDCINERLCEKSCVRNKLKKYCYTTSVEKWQPGTKEICCPFCSKISTPFIKRQKKRVTSSPIGAVCLMGCWPMCFIPFLMSQSNIMLFCKFCKTFLGTYDKKKGCVRPPDLKELTC